MKTIIPITDPAVSEDLFNALSLVVRNMPHCGCGRFYKERDLVDPTCHRHAWLKDHEIQTLYFAYDRARRLMEKTRD